MLATQQAGEGAQGLPAPLLSAPGVQRAVVQRVCPLLCRGRDVHEAVLILI